MIKNSLTITVLFAFKIIHNHYFQNEVIIMYQTYNLKTLFMYNYYNPFCQSDRIFC